jgi:hypothetical protein
LPRALSCAVVVAAGWLHAQAPAVPVRPTVSAAADGVAALPPPVAADGRALLTRYCITCHNDRLRTAQLALDQASIESPGANAELWEKVARRLRSGTMPPPGRPRPDRQTAVAVASSLERALDEAAARHPNPGRPLVHRLNRSEYANAVRDLLALEFDARQLLPADDSAHGFDNIAANLSVSPALMERYMAAARRIARLAVGDPTIGPALESRTYHVPKALFQDDRMSEELPFGSRGGLSIRHFFPLDGDYVLKVRLRRNVYDYIRGLEEQNEVDVRLDGRLVKSLPIGGDQKGTPAPVSFAGPISGSQEWEEYAHSADAALEIRFAVRAGPHQVAVSFVDRPWAPEGVLQPPLRGYASTVSESTNSSSDRPGPAVESISIAGPFDGPAPGDTPSRRRIFSCQPGKALDEAACARQILQTLARRAYRRPATGQDVETLFRFFEAGRRARGFDAGIQSALQRLLVDPEFLFRVERDPADAVAGTAYRVTDLELASRLSFFLWSSSPDDELLDVAARNGLRDARVLERQVARMLADPRSDALVENFAAQWLTLRNLRGAAPDPGLFPEFDENLRDAFQRETELFIASQIRDDRSVVDVLTANYTFLNERLARHYQIAGVHGSQFRRVPLAGDQRLGLLGHGSILTVTSYGNRTSPVLRGHWLLDNILGEPPPPPPPDVPALRDVGENGERRSVRERMEQHRRNPACASCHARMDPLGFALENYDAIGRWRTTGEGGAVIDAAASLPDGHTFDGVAGLRALLSDQRERFVETLAEKLFTYAVGRGVEYYDRPAIRAIARDTLANGSRWSSLILSTVRSDAFQMRRSRP